MTFEKINILPNDKSAWRIHKGFEIIPGSSLGLFKWKYDDKTSLDMELWDAVRKANDYAEELKLIEKINKEANKADNGSGYSERPDNSPRNLLAKFLCDKKNIHYWAGEVPATMYWEQLNVDAAERLLSLDISCKRRYTINDEYDMSILTYLGNLGYITIDRGTNEVKITAAGLFLRNTYSK